MKKRFHSDFVPAIGTLLLAVTGCSSERPSEKPNLILILADDMGYSDLGCFGSEIRTPNLDRLAKQGLRMTQFYNASRSCPTRASLLTGLYQHQAGVGDMVSNLGYPSYQGYLNDKCATLAEALKIAGYNTYMSGKWHVGKREGVHPLDRGFDRFFGLIDGGGSYFRRIAYRPNNPVPLWTNEREEYWPPDSGFYLTDAITDHALRFIEDGLKSTEPFFLYLAYTAPHWPLHALPEDIERYRGKYLSGWDELRKERYNRMLQMGIIDPSMKLSPRDERSPDWNTLSDEQKQLWDLRMAVYAAMIDRMDQNIGRVVNNLAESGELDNTLIIFISDNGGCHESTKNQAAFLKVTGETGTPDSFDAYEYPWANASNTPFRMFKHWVHEGGISTPFIAFCPEMIKGGMVSSQTGHIIDIMPTLLDAAGGEYPEEIRGNDVPPMEGISLLPVFKGKALKRKAPLFWEHEGNRAVRDGDWKLVSAYDYSKKQFKSWELYNIKNDRSELKDLSEEFPEQKEKMIMQFNSWSERAGVVSKKIIDSK
ncbi:MAG TPA: arylsulfatase [Bacteroidales bacterium]|nr:arylsulfatase [Bacteroidales bacterium]HPJ60057.1 arylsulfatase [Bacteroidales bacterium]HPR11739.1 arylsulfatase [Bacteroidales bacterium]HRW85453.1 arylsulfatase [Bacteroidales bacterium]